MQLVLLAIPQLFNPGIVSLKSWGGGGTSVHLFSM